jgi:L-lactate utilization protein LutB
LDLEKGKGVPKKKAKQNVTTSIKSKSQVIKDIKLKEIMAFAGVSPIESTSIPT